MVLKSKTLRVRISGGLPLSIRFLTVEAKAKKNNMVKQATNSIK